MIQHNFTAAWGGFLCLENKDNEMIDADILAKVRSWKEIFGIRFTKESLWFHGNPGDADGGFSIWEIPNPSPELINQVASEFSAYIRKD